MAERRSIALAPLVAAAGIIAAVGGVAAWWFSLQAIEARIQDHRGAVKRLSVSGGIPPNKEVMEYLTARQASLEQRYRHWLALIAAPPLAEAATADPQLYFQEQLHDVQRTLERLATARGVAVPEQLGFPKELPPSETVPRLLVQLSLIQELAALILDRGVVALSSFKVEDPEPVAAGESGPTLLTRLPVRVRLTGTLPQLMSILQAMERSRPRLDLRALRVVPDAAGRPAALGVAQAGSQPLEIEMVLARYLVAAHAQDLSITEDMGRQETTKPVNRR